MRKEISPNSFDWVKRNAKRFALAAVTAIVFSACSEPGKVVVEPPPAPYGISYLNGEAGEPCKYPLDIEAFPKPDDNCSTTNLQLQSLYLKNGSFAVTSNIFKTINLVPTDGDLKAENYDFGSLENPHIMDNFFADYIKVTLDLKNNANINEKLFSDLFVGFKSEFEYYAKQEAVDYLLLLTKENFKKLFDLFVGKYIYPIKQKLDSGEKFASTWVFDSFPANKIYINKNYQLSPFSLENMPKDIGILGFSTSLTDARKLNDILTKTTKNVEVVAPIDRDDIQQNELYNNFRSLAITSHELAHFLHSTFNPSKGSDFESLSGQEIELVLGRFPSDQVRKALSISTAHAAINAGEITFYDKVQRGEIILTREDGTPIPKNKSTTLFTELKLDKIIIPESEIIYRSK